MTRYELFHRGSLALSRLGLSDGSNYRCPICENDFKQDDIDSGALTLEHIPPQSVGADLCMLTCKSCNTKAGTKLDSQVAIRHQNIQFAKGPLTKRAETSPITTGRHPRLSPASCFLPEAPYAETQRRKTTPGTQTPLQPQR